MMSTGLRALALSMLWIGSALAEDQTLIVEKVVEAHTTFGGVFGLFRKPDLRFKNTQLHVRARSGAVTIQSITLNKGSCTFHGAALPTTVKPGERLNLVPDCDVTLVEATTDRGSYKISLH